MLPRGCLTLLAIPITLAAVLWAIISLQIGFYDSMASYRPPATLADLAMLVLVD